MPRVPIWILAVLITILSSASARNGLAATFTVNVGADGVDGAPGDGFCAAGPGCTLRAAIMEANALAGPDVVLVPAGEYFLTIGNSCSEGDPASQPGYDDRCADLDVTDDLLLVGEGAYRSRIRAEALNDDGNTGVLDIAPGVVLTLRDLLVGGGRQLGSGGGLRARGATVLIERVVFYDNRASFAGGGLDVRGGTTTIRESLIYGNLASTASIGGGGLFHSTEGPVTTPSLVIVDSTFAFNQAGAGAASDFPPQTDAQGGGLTLGAAAVVELHQVTIFANDAFGRGGGLSVLGGVGSVLATSSTITGNRSDQDSDADIQQGGGLSNQGEGPVTLRNSILADNTDPGSAGDRAPDCLGTLTDVGFTLIGDSIGCSFAGASESNLSGDPMLGGFGDWGGQVPTLALLAGSQVIDAGDNSSCGVADARGLSRFVNLTCDLGAFETGNLPSFRPKVEVDLEDGAVGDGRCGGSLDDLPMAVCSLRSAVQEINALDAPASRIDLAAARYELSLPDEGEDQAAEGDLDVAISGQLVISGEGSSSTTIDGGGIDRVFHVDPFGDGGWLRLFDLTVVGGAAVGGRGGLLRIDSGRLSAEGVTFRAGLASFGAGLAAGGSAQIDIEKSALLDGRASVDGGGLYLDGAATALIEASTLAANWADRSGGAIAVADGALELLFSTLTNNVADANGDLDGAGGGLFVADEVGPIRGSIIAANGASVPDVQDCSGGVDSAGYNFVGLDGGCFFAASGDQAGVGGVAIDPQLLPRGYYAGATESRPPSVSSPVIDAGDPAGCGATDQRAFTRPFDGDLDGAARCDIGAIESALGLFFDGFESGDLGAWAETQAPSP